MEVDAVEPPTTAPASTAASVADLPVSTAEDNDNADEYPAQRSGLILAQPDRNEPNTQFKLPMDRAMRAANEPEPPGSPFSRR